jgi:hypothetical protein
MNTVTSLRRALRCTSSWIKSTDQKRLHSAPGYVPPTESEAYLAIQAHKDSVAPQLSL